MAMFHKMDANRSGQLDRAELKAGLKMVHQKFRRLSEAQLDIIVVNLDSSGDGLVSCQELLDRAFACRINAVREKLCANVVAGAGNRLPCDIPDFEGLVARFYAAPPLSFAYNRPQVLRPIRAEDAPPTTVEAAADGLGWATAVTYIAAAATGGGVLAGFGSGSVALYSRRRKRVWCADRMHRGAVLGFEELDAAGKHMWVSADSTGRVLFWLPEVADRPLRAIECGQTAASVLSGPALVQSPEPKTGLHTSTTLGCFCTFRHFVVTGGSDGTVRLWTANGQLHLSLLPPRTSATPSNESSRILCIAANSDRIAAIDASGRLLIWEPDCPTDVATGASSKRRRVRPQLVLDRGDSRWLSQTCWALTFQGELRLWCGLENGCIVLVDFETCLSENAPPAKPVF